MPGGRTLWDEAGISLQHSFGARQEISMDFPDSVKKQLTTRAYWNFRGRATVSEFWFFALFAFASGLFLEVLSFFSEAGAVIHDLWSLFLLLPFLATLTRRLHDSGHSMLLPIIDAFCAAGTALFISRSLILAAFNPGAGMWQLLDDPNLVYGLVMLAATLLLSLILLILLILPSNPGENKYGAMPADA
jgi:uncharacterized membrane protein YhaH (DUF805 family)